MNKKKLIILIVIILLILSAVGYYIFKNKKVETPNNIQEQGVEQQNNEQIPATKEETTLRAKVLELVGKANAGKTQEALAGYLALEKDNPTDLMLLNNIADLYSDMSNWTKSEEYYKKVLSSNPDYISGYRMLAYLYQYRFNDNEAKIKALIDDGLAKNKNNRDLLSWIIDYYQQKNEGDKALPYSKLLTDQLNKQ
jgi:tetratricopeptide (TPR) repeat protein